MAIALPMPLEAPVTNTIFPRRSMRHHSSNSRLAKIGRTAEDAGSYRSVRGRTGDFVDRSWESIKACSILQPYPSPLCFRLHSLFVRSFHSMKMPDSDK